MSRGVSSISQRKVLVLREFHSEAWEDPSEKKIVDLHLNGDSLWGWLVRVQGIVAEWNWIIQEEEGIPGKKVFPDIHTRQKHRNIAEDGLRRIRMATKSALSFELYMDFWAVMIQIKLFLVMDWSCIHFQEMQRIRARMCQPVRD